ncbi:prolyl aminopeptidase [Pikeienuella piscinae]|uniref:Proline iminopeptidase n=2 Tax=Pikeienuella piscinae TaxID=2748098 RepID=A0A7M3T5P2_9RHOB|nr:prolyl aminopeptidase [Pikeienuella piscinae]
MKGNRNDDEDQMTPPRRSLYPQIEPFNRFRMEVSGGHDIYVEECGTKGARPVVVLHGGPGGGCSPGMRRYFDPEAWHIILFDQRGCGRSRPHASVERNTTWDLVEDIEAIRRRVGVERWSVFGGSWGATLALIYAETHPKRVVELTLRGVFLMMERELDWFYGGGASIFWPDLWEEFLRPIPEDERGDLIGAYHKRLMGGDISVQTECARIWARWEGATATMRADDGALPGYAAASYARAFARIECHYFRNRGFLAEDGQILRDIGRIRDIPGVIVQGRYDMVCPPLSAFELHRAWPGSELRMIGDAGHALSEPGITAELVATTDAARARPLAAE